MGNKKDMFIDYERSYKKRGKKGNKKVLSILLVIFAVVIGFSAFFAVRSKINSDKNKDLNQEEDAGKDASGNHVQYPTDIPKVTAIPSPTPSTLPTSTPTPAPTPSGTADKNSVQTSAGNEDMAANPVTVKGIYVPALTAGSDKINDLIELADSTEINAMVIDVKDDHGKVSYNMDSEMAKQIGATTDTITDMPGLIKQLKEKNIYLIARIVAFKDPYLADKRQDLAIKNKDGSLYVDNNKEAWVNPYNKNVWKYLVDIATQAAAVGFDEIQFDYIRFSTGKGIANADFGDIAKTKSREDIITEFTKYAYENLKPLGVYVSADVYGAIINSSVDASLVGQNYVDMSKYLDYICPMIYPSHFGEGNYGIQYPDLEPFNIINKVLTASENKLGDLPKEEHHAIVRPWLQDFTATWIEHYMEYGGPEVRQEIEGVYSAGYGEWLLWNSGSKYSEDGLLQE